VKIYRVIRIKLNQLVYENVGISTILQRKWCPSKKHFAELDLQHGGKTAGIDMIWRKYVTVTLCIPYGGHKYCCVAKRCKVDSRKQHLPWMLAHCTQKNQEPITHVHVRYMLSSVRLSSVCHLSVCLSSVTFVHPTQAVQIFGNISTALGTLAIRGHRLKILRRLSQGNPSAGGVKNKRGSQI